MPEGDAVFRTARRLDRAFRGDVIERSDLRWPSLATASLVGWTTLEVVPRGKHLLHRFDSGWTLHSHLRMDGRWHVRDADAPFPRDHTLRAALGTSRATGLGFSLGMLDLVPTADERTLIGHLGPDVLGRTMDADAAVANLAASDEPLAAALLDQRNVAGFGTIWVSESAHALGLDPFAPASSFAPETLRHVLAWTRRHMGAAALGQDIDPSVFGRRHHPCRRCGTLIRRDLTGPAAQERGIYYCPRCQNVTEGGLPDAG